MIDYTNRNFWKENPELILTDSLGKLYKSDKSKNKDKSSLTMWAIYFCEHPESKFFNHPNKYNIIGEKVLKEKDFNWESIEIEIDEYKNFILTDAERALSIWNDTIRERNINLKKMYKAAFNNSDTAELVQLDKMMSNTPKFFEDYKKIKLDYEEEKVKKKGSKVNSLSDADEI